MQLYTLFAIAGGGALGALSRHFINMMVASQMKAPFPAATLAVNVSGSFLMGAFIVLFSHFWTPPQEIRLFLITGFLGAFTTFSAFSLDVMTLWSRTAYVEAATYVAASVVLSIGAVFAGSYLVSKLIGDVLV